MLWCVFSVLTRCGIINVVKYSNSNYWEDYSMTVIVNKYGQKRIYISKHERHILHSDLVEAFMAGGRDIVINYKKDLASCVTVYDSDNLERGKIVGTSAAILAEIFDKPEDDVFMSRPISIHSVIAEYCGGE